MTTPYTTGSVTLTNGSAVVTGVGTAWQTALIAGGTLYAEADGNPLPILSVDSNTQITSAIKWKGATGSYPYAIMRDTAYGQQTVANAQALSTYLQRLDSASLSALASLAASMTADKFAYTTGLSSMAWTALSAFGRETLALGDAAAWRNKIGAFASAGGTIAGNLTVSGSEVVNGSHAAGNYSADAAAGIETFLSLKAAGGHRFVLSKTGEPETGGNVGANFALSRWSDAGAYIDAPIIVNRRTGCVTMGSNPRCAGTPYGPIQPLAAGQYYGLLRSAVGFDMIVGPSGMTFSIGGNPGAGGRVVHVPHTAWYRITLTVTANSPSGQSSLTLARNGAAVIPVLFIPATSSSYSTHTATYTMPMTANDHLCLYCNSGSVNLSLEHTNFSIDFMHF
ncbi:hypothetical protein IB267_26875 [Ensifer sp. ENS09]|uniref:hypothetical protein n=1 Tax=Ensifer sp. ENS09 TaxID=2769263 RepID=UPI001781952B|nr:hypothetical protein [Ensifer sp. ENS09]MBD9651988.1 hypothetical protein [Ensifer sp. ENS09]